MTKIERRPFKENYEKILDALCLLGDKEHTVTDILNVKNHGISRASIYTHLDELASQVGDSSPLVQRFTEDKVRHKFTLSTDGKRCWREVNEKKLSSAEIYRLINRMRPITGKD